MATSNNNIITPDTLKPVEPMQTVSPVQDTTNYGGIVSGVYDSILNEYNTLNANVKAGEKVQTDTGSDILSIMNELTGKTGATQTAQETAGVNKAREEQNKYAEQLANLNAQASVLNREAQAIPLQVQEQFKNTGATDRGVAPIETGKLRENAIRALSIAQQSDIAAAALTGSQLRLESAQQKAQQIIDLKYKPLEQELAIKKQQYDLNKDILDKYDKKRAEALNIQLKKEETALAEAKQNEKDIQALKLKIIENGGNPSILDNAKTFDEALTLGASALKTPNNEIRELNGALYMIDKNTGKSKLIAGGGGGTGGVVGGGKGVVIPKPVTDAINTILGSGKFTKDQATAVRNAINNGEDPLVVIKNNAKNIMGQTEATALGKYETAKQSMTDLDNSLKQYYANGGKTNLLKGNYEKVINNLGQVDDPRLVELAVQIQTNLQVYRNAVSGTAYSVQEGKDIASIFPGINKTEGLNQAIINGRQKAFDSTIDGTYKNVLGSNYDKLKNIQSGALPKSGMSDKDYVEKVLSSKNIRYDDFVNNVPQGQIPVIDNATGQTGYIPYLEFNSSKYTKI